MLPLKGIQSIQKAVVTKPPPGIPAHYPPQFHIVLGGELNTPVVCFFKKSFKQLLKN